MGSGPNPSPTASHDPGRTVAGATDPHEVGTVKGVVRPGSKTEAFMKAVSVPVHIPLSGKTLEFDAAGKCTAGC